MSPPIEIDAVLVRQRDEPARERGEPGRRRPTAAHRQQRPARRRAHRRQIRQVDRQRLVAERLGFGVREEMAALDEHVDRHGEFAAGRWRDERRIVADADARALRAGRRK